MLREHYQTFNRAIGDALHVLAHSHHPWPDVTRAAHLACWEDAAQLAERKWQKIYAEIIPEAQGHVARLLGIDAPERVAFAQNTHELIARLYSSLDWTRPVRVLTTDREFASFARQTRRLEETGRLHVRRIAVEPYASFVERFADALADEYEFVYLSQVFYDSGFHVTALERLIDCAPHRALVCIDGYHAFNALPFDLSRLAERVYYVAGGYKYAQAGEGACFMTLPRACALRPLHTGWFAAPDETEQAGDKGPLQYGAQAQRFAGATFDASGLYRFNAVMRWQRSLDLTPELIHAHALQLQERFLDGLATQGLAQLPVASLQPPRGEARGNFCSFEIDGAKEVEARLRDHGIRIDRRGARLRFGFGVYHDDLFVDRLLARLRQALR